MRDCLSSISVLEATLIDAEVSGDTDLCLRLNMALCEQQEHLGYLIDDAIGIAPMGAATTATMLS